MSARNLTEKLLDAHLVGEMPAKGSEMGIRIDQTLTQDATGTLVMLELEAMGLERVHTQLSAQYVDHNLLQTDYKNPDDHLFLRSGCRKFGIWYSKPGNGVSHPVHMEHFGVPGKTLLGSDSHTCAAGALGMLAIGTGGLEVALAMAGKPFHFERPEVVRVHLDGELPNWVSAKDIILEMLRRRGVKGGVKRVFEYAGEGLKFLSVMDRHVIANMGAEMGATSSIFPSDGRTRRFLERRDRGQDWIALEADEGAKYDEEEYIDLANLEPLIALPGSPGHVVPVREVAGKPIYQAYIGSSANPGFRDFAVVAMLLDGKQVPAEVSLDINPSSRQVLENLTHHGYLEKLIRAGARIHQAGCNGCIGMGQSPASGQISLRTVPRNFPGRSGTEEDQVFLCSPETAAVSAIQGRITDPRSYSGAYPQYISPATWLVSTENMEAPSEDGTGTHLVKGPNIRELPPFPSLPGNLDCPISLKMGDNVSTDEIMPAGAQVLPFRSNIPKISSFAFSRVDPGFVERAMSHQAQGSIIIGGENYGQGSSREHAALGPRFLGVKAVIALGFARIHRSNLINFGIVPLTLLRRDDWETLEIGDVVRMRNLRDHVGDARIEAEIRSKQGEARTITLGAGFSPREQNLLLQGGVLNAIRKALGTPDS